MWGLDAWLPHGEGVGACVLDTWGLGEGGGHPRCLDPWGVGVQNAWVLGVQDVLGAWVIGGGGRGGRRCAPDAWVSCPGCVQLVPCSSTLLIGCQTQGE